jgi:acetyl-CoA carboxylase carboxyl transferase subunit beta
MPGFGGPAGKAPDDIWVRCSRCRELLYKREWESNFKVCPKCGFHERLTSAERIALLLDPGSFEELGATMRSGDPLGFAPPGLRSYAEKLAAEQRETGLREAAVYGRGTIDGLPIVFALVDRLFFTGSMASVVGEKITRAFELAAQERRPLVICSASAGARQQEGVVALMQMAKTVAAANRLAQQRVPYISILTNETLGGVTASYATLADCIIAEPGAVIGFAGPRVVEQTTGEKLPPGAQTAEFQLEHGMVDLVVPRRDLKETVARLIRLYLDAAQRAWQSAPAAAHELAAVAAG